MISLDEEDFLVPMYLKKHPFSATMLVAKDQRDRIKSAYSVEGIPANLVIDARGTIQRFGSGYGPGVGGELRKWLDEALSTAGGK
jgi:hypothetical protein